MRSVVVFAMIGALLSGMAPTVAAGAPVGAAGHVPKGVDEQVLRAPVSGPVVASGVLRTADGKGRAGLIAVLAWPNEDALSRLNEGDSVPTPTVGWVATKADGSFAVRVAKGRINASHKNADGRVNFLAVGWTPENEGTLSFAAPVDGTPSADPIMLDAVSPNSGLAPASAPEPNIITPCSYVQKTTTYPWVEVGVTWPYGADTGWMVVGSTHSFTVGVGISASGDYGDWKANGTSTVSEGLSKTFSRSTAYVSWQLQHRYVKYQKYCGTVPQPDWMIKDIGWAGYNQSVTAPAQPSWAYCGRNDPGEWYRDSSSGSHLTTSAGVKLGPIIGLNLSFETNYGSDHKIGYYTAVVGKVCGSNDDPAWAEYVKTSR